jgi:predicted TIM-barrel fold metal-dependent hydrolase
MTTNTTNPTLDRVDFHHHLFPVSMVPEAMRGALFTDGGWKFPDGLPSGTLEESLTFMDGLGVRTAILSLPNDVESSLPENVRARFARTINTIARQAVEDHPGRFGFFAHLPTPTDVEAALEEVAYAFDVLGADGVTLTNVYGAGEQAR